MHLSGAIPVFLVSTISLRNETSCVPISEPSLETFIAITAGGANMIMNAIAIATADCSPTGTPINLPNVCIGPNRGLGKAKEYGTAANIAKAKPIGKDIASTLYGLQSEVGYLGSYISSKNKNTAVSIGRRK